MKKLLINTVLFSFLTLLFISCSTMQGLGAMTAAVGAAFDAPILTAVGTSTASIARASEAITPEQEYYIGRGVAASIADTYKVANKPQIEAYLNSICQTLVINSERPVIFNGYHVAVLDTDEINAFATSGGHIFITKHPQKQKKDVCYPIISQRDFIIRKQARESRWYFSMEIRHLHGCLSHFFPCMRTGFA